MSKKISSYTFLLLAHYATFAYQDLLFEYLTKNKARLVTKMNFPLPELPYLKNLEITKSEKGIHIHKKKYLSVYSPPIIAYPFQSIQLILHILFSFKKYDVVIAEDTLLAFLAVILRMIGRCKKIIFYSHGIDHQRFSIPLLNRLYFWLDKFSATHSDFDWFLNNNFYTIRTNQGISKERLFWIPASVSIKSMAREKNIFNHNIVFLGVVNRKNGAHIFVDIIKKIKEKVPDVHLDIIGNGDFMNSLKKEIAEDKLEKHVSLFGLLDFKDFAKLLTHYSVGIAPYEDKFDTLTASSDSMKMRVYLAAGVPVIITRGFIFSKEIEENTLGFTPAFNADEIAKDIITIIKDKKLNQKMRQNALEYSKKMDVYTIYNKTFSTILNF